MAYDVKPGRHFWRSPTVRECRNGPWAGEFRATLKRLGGADNLPRGDDLKVNVPPVGVAYGVAVGPYLLLYRVNAKRQCVLAAMRRAEPWELEP
ncbi:MAG: hypothetical protein AAGA56_21015 [Myxococcota bacterium]